MCIRDSSLCFSKPNATLEINVLADFHHDRTIPKRKAQLNFPNSTYYKSDINQMMNDNNMQDLRDKRFTYLKRLGGSEVSGFVWKAQSSYYQNESKYSKGNPQPNDQHSNKPANNKQFRVYDEGANDFKEKHCTSGKESNQHKTSSECSTVWIRYAAPIQDQAEQRGYVQNSRYILDRSQIRWRIVRIVDEGQYNQLPDQDSNECDGNQSFKKKFCEPIPKCFWRGYCWVEVVWD
eukprot:TRINITY_DN1291_c0_g1_i2.p1 TRINITY_DN1291_c0_g1~~TRINITY_DN1291_c0_g1_i2.p1  ORF type:complete len:258 (-),score=-5.62 TRINITY_DN1291_c0_g1_i2:70-774(-)